MVKNTLEMSMEGADMLKKVFKFYFCGINSWFLMAMVVSYIFNASALAKIGESFHSKLLEEVKLQGQLLVWHLQKHGPYD